MLLYAGFFCQGSDLRDASVVLSDTFGPSSNFPTVFGCIAKKFGTNINGAQRMNPNDFK